MADWLASPTVDLDALVDTLDVVYLLRVQRERMGGSGAGDLDGYRRRFGLDAARAAPLHGDAIVLHPGPVNRGCAGTVDPHTALHTDNLLVWAVGS
jgi:aspartate carbamoyltransferase catalytic subunit